MRPCMKYPYLRFLKTAIAKHNDPPPCETMQGTMRTDVKAFISSRKLSANLENAQIAADISCKVHQKRKRL